MNDAKVITTMGSDISNTSVSGGGRSSPCSSIGSQWQEGLPPSRGISRQSSGRVTCQDTFCLLAVHVSEESGASDDDEKDDDDPDGSSLKNQAPVTQQRDLHTTRKESGKLNGLKQQGRVARSTSLRDLTSYNSAKGGLGLAHSNSSRGGFCYRSSCPGRGVARANSSRSNTSSISDLFSSTTTCEGPIREIVLANDGGEEEIDDDIEFLRSIVDLRWKVSDIMYDSSLERLRASWKSDNSASLIWIDHCTENLKEAALQNQNKVERPKREKRKEGEDKDSMDYSFLITCHQNKLKNSLARSAIMNIRHDNAVCHKPKEGK